MLLTLALVAIFCSALAMRIHSAKYGFYLNEFDPYFDYWATKFLVNSFDKKGFAGFLDYFTWVDKHFWYPEGRNVAPTSQGGLHFTGAILYLIARNIFMLNYSLYDFLVLLPSYLGALTVLIVFLLTRRLINATGALLSSLIFAFSPAVIVRGGLGWFKSEPLALFLTLSGLYFFFVAVDERVSSKEAVIKAALSGLLIGFANTCWGGSWFFSILTALMLIVAPFLHVEHKRITIVGSLVIPFILISSSLLPRPGPSFIVNPAGLLLILSFVFLTLSYFVRRIWEGIRSRNLVGLLVMLLTLGLAIAGFGGVKSVSGRYLTVINPFQRTTNPLVESVAEHYVPTGSDYFMTFAILLFFAVFGSVVAFRRRDLNSVFILIFAIFALYLSSSFSRLMVYSTIGLSLLASLGFVEVTSTMMKPSISPTVKKKLRSISERSETRVLFTILLLILLIVPLFYPPGSNWLSSADQPVSMANAGVPFRASLPDWREALEWIRNNTPEDAVIAAWWDYGYWITVVGNRTSLADNATLNSTRIKLIAKMFMSPEDEGIKILKSFKKNASKIYVLVFVAGHKIPQRQRPTLYLLGAGGDESKMQWIVKIGGFNMSEFYYNNTLTQNENFWRNTFLGKLFPFELEVFIDRQGREAGRTYSPGNIPLYSKVNKYNYEGAPLKLVFESSSLKEDAQKGGLFAGVIIYELKEDKG
jgi:dolichyl-diphosphooligosaccharide--protein glycosyltransferase